MKSLRFHSLSKGVCLALATVLLVNLAACGTLLYPERRGQDGGRIDPAIAILDGVGLLFFVVPGVIAFAVDFATGTIYLPGGRRRHMAANDSSLLAVKVPGAIDQKTLERVLALDAHVRVQLDSGDISVQKASSLRAVEERIALLTPA